MNSDLAAACADLWEAYNMELTTFCKAKMQCCPHEIEDIVSETFLALCKKADENGLPDNPRAWIYRTAKNLIFQRYRRNNIKKDDFIIHEHQHINMPDPIESIDDSDYIEKIKNILIRELPDHDVNLFMCIYHENLSAYDIAVKLNKSENAVKQKHYRHRIKIKNIASKTID